MPPSYTLYLSWIFLRLCFGAHEYCILPALNAQRPAGYWEFKSVRYYVNTYSSRLKSEDYHFEQGNLIYHDTYFGGKDFIGGEIVYKDEMPPIRGPKEFREGEWKYTNTIQ